MPSVTDFVVSMLALLMWREDGPDGLQGMTAAGLVVRNRVVAGWSGGDWLEVMAAHNQFAGVMAAESGPIRYPNTRDPKFYTLLLRARNVYEGAEPDITGGALYYAALANVNSPWFRTNILAKPELHARLGTVGAQTFFA